MIKHPKSEKSIQSGCSPLLVEYNPGLPNISNIINKHKHILDEDPKTNKIISSKSVFVSFKRCKNLKDLITHSRFNDKDTETRTTNKGCYKCKGCLLCNNFLIETATFKSCHNENEYNVHGDITCTDVGVIYLICDKLCNVNSVGSTLGNMRKRWSGHKSDIRIYKSSCEIANHCNSQSTPHTFSNRDNNTIYIKELKEQLGVILIEKVKFDDHDGKDTKLSKLHDREGYWQTELRTLRRFGGLNIRDERQISNNTGRERT